MADDPKPACPHCSRRQHLGHHPSCPNNPANLPQMIAVDARLLAALREAWLDMPIHGKVAVGDGTWLQPLLNAVTAIVDPDDAMKDEKHPQHAEYKLRGGIAGYRQRVEYAADTLRQAREQLADIEASETPVFAAVRWREAVKRWEAEIAKEIADCKAELGVDLVLPKYIEKVMP